jgi:hypothetical protein
MQYFALISHNYEVMMDVLNKSKEITTINDQHHSLEEIVWFVP